MQWLLDLFTAESAANTALVLCLGIIPGIWLGNRKIGTVKLGIAGVLFSGLLIGGLGQVSVLLHLPAFQFPLDTHTLRFLREFGLILFVFAVGLQVGPGFFANFRDQGLKLIAYAAVIVAAGVAIALVEMKLFHFSVEATVGMLSGAVTNTPGLGAASQALKEAVLATVPTPATATATADAMIATAGSAYAVAYPFGIFGIILSMILIRLIFRVNVATERANLEREEAQDKSAPETYSVEASNPGVVGKPYRGLDARVGVPVVISRLYRDKEQVVPGPDALIQSGDRVQVVCRESDLERVVIFFGSRINTDLRGMPGQVGVRRIIVSRARGAERLGHLHLERRLGVRVTRVRRSGIEFIPNHATRLHVGDVITVVGPEAGLDSVAVEMGDSRKSLDHPNLLPIFIGIVLGVLLGSIPVALPGLPSPVRLGLAGGPLIVALLMGYKGSIGRVHFYMSNGALQFMREFGIVLFLVAVGLLSGDAFFTVLRSGEGLVWMAASAAITFFPVFLVGLIARWRGLNYLTLSGVLAGSMTDPPALGYASSLAPTQAQAIAYASVYPFVMFLRVLSAQLLVMFFF